MPGNGNVKTGVMTIVRGRFDKKARESGFPSSPHVAVAQHRTEIKHASWFGLLEYLGIGNAIKQVKVL